MKTTLLALISIFLATADIAVAQQSETASDSLLSRADSLYKNNLEKEALQQYNVILERNPDHYLALWRASFLYSRIGNRLETEEEKRSYFNKGIELAKQALAVDSTDAESNFVMSVAMGRKALIAGARERVAASREIKKYVERALEQDSTHAGAWHVLGRWNFKIANLNFAERLAANLLFGGIPGDASNEKAAEYIERAIELKPNYILYHYDLARVYEEMGRDEQAVEECRTAQDLEVQTPDDPGFKEECRELMEDLQ